MNLQRNLWRASVQYSSKFKPECDAAPITSKSLKSHAWISLQNQLLKGSGQEGIFAELAILDEILAARKEAGLSQAQIAKRMGTQAPAIARLESALATGKHSPSLSTLRKYAAVLGKRVELHLV